jgi:hypothetical protein
MVWTAPATGATMCRIPVVVEEWRESAYGYKRTFRPLSHYVRFTPVASTGRRNTGVKSFGGRFKPQRFSWPFVQLTRHLIQMSL